MSKIALQPNASGSGTFTIAAPNSNSNRTLDLPDASTTLVGTDTTQTLSNKTISATTITTSSTAQFASTIGVGNATPSASGAGITFPATQSASTNANTLDDYEQGTWTPSVGGNATYSTQVGRYTKIGRMVYVQAALTIGTLGTGATRIISGLPFATSLQQDVESGISVAYFQGSAASFVFITPFAFGSEVRINSLTAAATQTSANNFFTNTTTIEFGGWYQAAD